MNREREDIYGLIDVPIFSTAPEPKDSDDFRNFTFKANFLDKVSGSGYAEFGNTCVLVSVEGPIEKDRELDEDVEDDSSVKIFADDLPQNYFNSLDAITDTFVRTDQLVNAEVHLNVKVVSDDGSVLAATVIAIGLALASSNVQQYDLPMASTILFESRTSTHPRVDPTKAECEEARKNGGGFVTVVALPNFCQVAHVYSEGVLTSKQMEIASTIGFQSALRLYEDISDTLRPSAWQPQKLPLNGVPRVRGPAVNPIHRHASALADPPTTSQRPPHPPSAEVVAEEDVLFSFNEFLKLTPEELGVAAFTNEALDVAVADAHFPYHRIVSTFHRGNGTIEFLKVNGKRTRFPPTLIQIVSAERRHWSAARRIRHRSFALSVYSKHPRADTLHPALRRGFKAYFCDAVSCFGMRCGCADFVRSLWPWRRTQRSRAVQYVVADVDEETVDAEWEAEKTNPAFFSFDRIENSVKVKVRGKVRGQQFTISNCKNCLLLILDATATVTIDDCENCVIVLGPCRGSVFVRDCEKCTVFSACQQFRTRDSTLMVHMFCSTQPIIEDSVVQFYPLFLRFDGVEACLLDANLPLFTNKWGKVHNFTPESGSYKIHEEVLPLNELHGPAFDWANELKTHGVKLNKTESYFFYTPSSLNAQKESTSAITLILCNLGKEDVKQFKRPFYEACWSLERSFTVDSQFRVLGTYEYVLKDSELGNILKEKKNKWNGLLVVVEVAGDPESARSHADKSLATAFPQLNKRFIEPEKTKQFRDAFRQLAASQNTV